MKTWVKKLIDQFEFDWSEQQSGSPKSSVKEDEEQQKGISEDRATLLFIIDTFNKHLLEIESKPVRKVRQTFDDFAKQLLTLDPKQADRALFRFRQFFSSYRIDEYTYVLKTFDDFRAIIWDFVDQLQDEFVEETQAENEIQDSLDQLKDAVESNSIEDLKNQSRQFIDQYIEYQTHRDTRRNARLSSLSKNLDVVKKKLIEANHNMSRDHLTNAFNRRSFDEKIKENWKLAQVGKKPCTLLMLDIDHFKKINDTYGHAIGDFVLIELVKLLQAEFARPADFVARVGGEEFAILLPDFKTEHAIHKTEKMLNVIRKQVFVQDEHQIKFTSSAGIAELQAGETIEQWMKRADDALYEAKNTGRNKYTVSEDPALKAVS